MNLYGQNKEDRILLHYFGDTTGCFLDCGANDGKKFSNTFALAEKGWFGLLVEPAKKAFEQLVKNYEGNENVVMVNAALGNENGEAVFYDSGIEEIHGGAVSLVATMSIPDKQKWEKAVNYTETKVEVITFEKLIKDSPYKIFDFISIDAEGYDLDILRQINLKSVGCMCICVEHNSNQRVLEEIKKYCSFYGLTKELLRNAENIIVALP